MPREKQYYTLDEMILDQYTFGAEYMYPSGKEYIGLYHQYITTGEIYTGAKWDNKSSQKLIPYVKPNQIKQLYQSLNKSKTQYTLPKKYFVTLSQQDIQQRNIKRYFLFKINELSFIEIDNKQYTQLGATIDPNMFQGIILTWYIAGPIETTITKNTKSMGVRERNELEILKISRTYPTIRKYLTNPLEFYIDTDLIIPPDIN